MKNNCRISPKCILALLFVNLMIYPCHAYCQSDDNIELMRRYEELMAKKKKAAENPKEQETRQGQLSQEKKSQISNTINKSFTKVAFTEIRNLGPLSNEDFARECRNIISQGENAIPAGTDILVYKSVCLQEGGKLVASYYMETSDNIFSSNNKLTEVSSLQTNQQRKEYEAELQKIRNTKQMYKDMIAALNKELVANGIDVVDNGLGLVVKNVELSGPESQELKELLDYAREMAIAEARKKYGVDHIKPIENKTANIVNSLFSLAGDVISLVPGGDKVTNHALWRLAASTPELGKMLGNGGACIHIYLRKSELEKEYAALLTREQVIVNSIESLE